MTSFGFLPHILQPTRISDFSSSNLDNRYSNNPEQDPYAGNIISKSLGKLSLSQCRNMILPIMMKNLLLKM